MVNASDVYFGDVATYTCPELTIQSGEVVHSVCGESGAWSPVNITCTGIHIH